MSFLNGMATLLFFQLLGEVIVMMLGLSIPGPVVGMIFLFITLLILGKVPEFLSFTSGHLLAHLSLLFVPAGVGVVIHLKRIGSEWFPIVTTLFVSTLVSMAVTALVMQWVLRRLASKERSS